MACWFIPRRMILRVTEVHEAHMKQHFIGGMFIARERGEERVATVDHLILLLQH